MSDITIKKLADLDAAERAALTRRSEADLSFFLDKVQPIIDAVKTEGDAALVRFGRDFDKATSLTAETLKVSPAEFDEAYEMVDPKVIDAIRFGIENIRTFHEEQAPEPMWLKEVRPGAYAGDRYMPIKSVALYVPRGKGSFPSVTMMTAVPGVVAKVPNLAIFTPPGPDGKVDAATLVAARIAGVETVYKCGGAQAVAAAAFGTETIAKAQKIVGPGSPWVVAAKRLLAGVIDPGLPAGPSEVMILADDTVSGRLAAMDLLIEAEHGPDSSAWLVTPSERVIEEALAALPELWGKMTEQRVEFSRTVLTGASGGIVLARDMDDACAFVNDYAPEHLEILSTKPFDYLGDITEASEILLGTHTPVSIANFALGPNAVLPTSKEKGYPEMAQAAKTLAEYEGFSSHANAVSDLRQDYLKAK